MDNNLESRIAAYNEKISQNAAVIRSDNEKEFAKFMESCKLIKPEWGLTQPYPDGTTFKDVCPSAYDLNAPQEKRDAEMMAMVEKIKPIVNKFKEINTQVEAELTKYESELGLTNG